MSQVPFTKWLAPLCVAAIFVWVIVIVMTTPGLKPVVISMYAPPIIHAEHKTQDLGTVYMDSHAEKTFHLYNLGGHKLHINKVEASCGCTVAKVAKTILNPGEMTDIAVTMDTRVKLGHIKKKITVHSNDPRTPKLKLFLTGTILAQKSTHGKIQVKDRLVLFKGECATCHVQKGKGKTGKALFLADCAMCHGQQGQGAVAPSLVRANYADPKVVAHLRKTIEQGAVNNPTMPPFLEQWGGPLSDTEIESLLVFLQFQAEQAKTGTPPVAEEDEE